MKEPILLAFHTLVILPAFVTFGGFPFFVFGLLMTYRRYNSEIKRRAWPLLLLPPVCLLVVATGYVFRYPGQWPKAGPVSEAGDPILIGLLVLTVLLSALTIWLMRKAWPFALFYALVVSSYILGAAMGASMAINADGF